MSDEERANWKKVKDALEEKGATDNYFYKRAVAICRGDEDPMKQWK